MINLYDDFSSEEELDSNFLRRGPGQDHGYRRPWIDIEDHGDPAANAGLAPMRRRQLPAVPSPPLSLDWLNLSAYGFPESVALSELPGMSIVMNDMFSVYKYPTPSFLAEVKNIL